MTDPHRASPFLLAAATALAAAACADVEEPSKTAHSDEKTSVAHAQTVKPGAAVSITHRLRSEVAPGESGVLTLDIEERYDGGLLSLSATSKSGLEIFPTSASAEIDMSIGDTHQWDVFFTAPSAGVYRIDVLVVAEASDGMKAPRSYAANVTVGSGAAAKAAQKGAAQSIDADGEAIVVLPAEETIED
ncbi:MAG: hypothetical protein AAFW81_02985 [Pseudomonadota bacterium]